MNVIKLCIHEILKWKSGSHTGYTGSTQTAHNYVILPIETDWNLEGASIGSPNRIHLQKQIRLKPMGYHSILVPSQDIRSHWVLSRMISCV